MQWPTPARATARSINRCRVRSCSPERAPAIANWITAAAIFFGGGLHWYTVATSGLLVTVGHWALVQAAKFDPQLSRVYIRHIRYQDYYPPRASICALPARVHPSVPTPREMLR